MVLGKKPWERSEQFKDKSNQRRLRKRFLIVTEGVDEKVYFQKFAGITSRPVNVVVKSAGDSKLSLVKKALVVKDETDWFNDDIDELWAVFDRDAYPNDRQDKRHFNEALEMAKRENVHVAYSNDSFELWFLYHFQEVQSRLHRDILCKKLSVHLGWTYKSRHTKHRIEKLYPEIKDNINLAIKRAKSGLKSQKQLGRKPIDANPSTTVGLLVEDITRQEWYRNR